MKVAIIDKCPSNVNYKWHFKFDFDLFHLSSVKLSKILRKDVDIDINVDEYDYIITVGSEASKFFAKITSVTDYAGFLVEDKYIPIMNPAILAFKPDNKPAFEKSLENIHKIISGENLISLEGTFLGIQNTEEAIQFLDLVDTQAKDTKVIFMDTETSSLYPRDGHVLGISICAADRYAGYIDSDCIDDIVVEKLQNLINKYKVVFHNAKFDIKMLQYHFSLKFFDYGDTIIMHYLLDETQGSHGLKQLALKYTKFGDYDKDLENFKDKYCRDHKILKEQFTYDLIPFNIIYRYAAIDTAVTLELYNMFFPILEKNPKLLKLYNTLMIPANSALIKIEETGVPFDKSRLEFAKSTISASINKATDHLYSLPEVVKFQENKGDTFNPNSVVQLRKLLFDELKLKPTVDKKTGTGMQSTDSEVLESLQGQHPVIDSILSIRKLGKIKNTYIDSISPAIDMDSRVRTGFNLINTTSGRLSSSGKFNAQQLPRDEMRIKGCIRGTGKYEGWNIVSQDLATAEMYYAAVLSGDKRLQKVFIDKEDFHSSIAKQVFNLPCKTEDVKELFKDKRQAAKAISFGILYGSGASKVSDTVSKDSDDFFSLEDAQESIDLYFDTFSTLKKWLTDTKNLIKQQGFLYTSFGRKRRLKNVFSPDKGIASHEIRSGINAAVQSLASDINLFAAIDTLKEIEKNNLRAEIFMLVHDSIVAIVHPDDTEKYCKILADCTQKDRGFSIKGCPIGIDQEVGKDYSFGKFDKIWGDDYARFIEDKVAYIPTT